MITHLLVHLILWIQGTAATAGTSITLTFSTASDVWQVDDICVIPAGGVSFPVPPVNFEGYLYAISGQTLLFWNESRKAFDVGYYFDRVMSTIEVFDGKLLVGSDNIDGSSNYKYFYITVGGNP